MRHQLFVVLRLPAVKPPVAFRKPPRPIGPHEAGSWPKRQLRSLREAEHREWCAYLAKSRKFTAYLVRTGRL